MARGEQPRVEAVPERHNGVELSTIILSLGSGLYLPSSSPDASTHPNGSLQALHCCVLPFPSFFPSFQLWKGKWFSRRSLERFLRCLMMLSRFLFFFIIFVLRVINGIVICIWVLKGINNSVNTENVFIFLYFFI